MLRVIIKSLIVYTRDERMLAMKLLARDLKVLMEKSKKANLRTINPYWTVDLNSVSFGYGFYDETVDNKEIQITMV